MRLLLDTHVLLWALADDARLTPAARRHIEGATEVFVSAASFWELAIKIGLGKLAADLAQIRETVGRVGFEELPVTGEHAQALLSLPALHRDPFDRLLVAQAISEPLHLLTADALVAQYTGLAIRV